MQLEFNFDYINMNRNKELLKAHVKLSLSFEKCNYKEAKAA